eukprot:5613261-Prymnesium_polylepis.2
MLQGRALRVLPRVSRGSPNHHPGSSAFCEKANPVGGNPTPAICCVHPIMRCCHAKNHDLRSVVSLSTT